MPRLGSRVRVSFSALSDVLKMTYAQVAELVDAHVSGACVERHAGSSPVLGTLLLKKAEFRWPDSLNVEMVEKLLNQNAPSLLLGYLRPIISQITAASPYNAYNLPFIDFSEK